MVIIPIDQDLLLLLFCTVQGAKNTSVAVSVVVLGAGSTGWDQEKQIAGRRGIKGQSGAYSFPTGR